MKVVCNKGYFAWITKGKIYDVTETELTNEYVVVDDNGRKKTYSQDNFTPLSEFRRNKLSKILNNGL